MTITSAVDRIGQKGLSVAAELYLRFAAAIGLTVFTLYTLLVAATVVVLPDANWDMLPYLAVAEESRHADPASLHDSVYAAVKSGVPESEYRSLTEDGGGFRSQMAADPAAFHSMLPMYRVKFLYAEILSGVSTMMPPVTAIRAVQVFSTLLFGAVVLLWLRSVGALALAPVLAAVMMVGDFAAVARAGTPDLLFAAVLMLGLYAHVRQREALSSVALFLAVLVRPDNVVFVVIFAALLLAFRQLAWGALAAALASVLAYLAIARWADHPGWWPHLYFSSIEAQMNMDGFHPAFSPSLYAKAFILSFVRAVTANTWVGVCLLALAGWGVTHRRGFGLAPRGRLVLAALALTVAAKFVVFPIHDTRVFFGYLIPPFLLLTAPLAALVASAKPPVASRLS